MSHPKITIVIPTYNEEKVIANCLASLAKQTVKDLEIIVVDDGSNDFTISLIQKNFPKVKLLKENHRGTGVARNLGAKEASGDILVFVDADMEFSPNFLAELTAPIVSGKAIGTYSTEEHLLNKDNVWATCWNLNLVGSPSELSARENTSLLKSLYFGLKKVLEKVERVVAPVSNASITSLGGGGNTFPFRAILKKEFLAVGGFTVAAGYTDDWTVAEKLQQTPTPTRAVYYHRNPASLTEIWRQARWIGRDRFKSGNFVRQVHSLLVFNPLTAVIVGSIKLIKYQLPEFILFQFVYSTGIMTSVLESFIHKSRAR